MRWPLGIALLFVLPGHGWAQQSVSRCSGNPPDSLWLAAGPIYRDCEVDKPAKLRGRDPDLDSEILLGQSTDSHCLRFTLEFVVDSLGQPDPEMVRVVSSDNKAVATAIVASLSQLRFAPAQIAKRPVRQVVVYRRSVATVVGFSVARLGSRAAERSPPDLSKLQSC